MAAKKHWFYDMTPAQKKAYLAKHPTSKYAKKSIKRIPSKIKPAKTKRPTKEEDLRDIKKFTEDFKASERTKKLRRLRKSLVDLRDGLEGLHKAVKPLGSVKRKKRTSVPSIGKR